jgi:secretion/DNA translocation related CpaE-like protein
MVVNDWGSRMFRPSISGPVRGQEPTILAVTSDVELADDVLRLGAAVGVRITVVPDALSAAPRWQGADLVLVDAGSVAGLRALGVPQRSRAVLVAEAPVEARVWQASLAVGITAVVSLPEGEQWLLEALAEAAGRQSSVAPVAVIVGARGGVGSTVLAVALAWVAAAEGLSSYLLDLDPLGCGAQVMLGVDHLPGGGWAEVDATAGRVPPRALREGLPSIAGVKVMGWPSLPGGTDGYQVASGAAGSVIDAAARDGDVVIVDLPRWACRSHADPDPFAMEALTRGSQIIVVSSADVRSALAGRRLLAHGRLAGLPVGLVVRGPAPGGLTADDIAEALEVPLLAFMPHERGLDRSLEDGFPPGSRRNSAVRSTALRLLEGLADTLTNPDP